MTATQARADALFTARLDGLRKQTDKTFAALMVAQWLFALVIALTYTPYAWEGRTRSLHPHVWAALALGAAISSLPIALAYLRPGEATTRYVVAVAQMLWSSLLIHLTGGRIETHFHVFGSLAFLAFYRDWRVLVPATIVVAADHLVRQIFWPESVFGIPNPEWWRTLEHAFWVVFEDTFLVLACVRGVEDVRVTARKQAEAETASADAILARDAAEKANRIKSQFLANMSHELRTPINGVVGLTDLLARTELAGRQRQYVETLRGSAETLLAVVNDVLDFSKIEAGKLELQSLDLDPTAISHATVDLVAPQAHAKGLEIACHIARDVPTRIVGDPWRLQQVLTNLLGNAMKFTERGEVVLSVSLAGEKLRFEVRDTGIGIDAAQVGKLFRAFSQVDDSNSRRFGGTGLGLAIAKQLVEMMGGEIGVDTRPGTGSTFWFTIAFGRAVSPSDAPPATDVPPTLRAMRVLIVDDNATNRTILREQLGDWFGVVDDAPDGATALAMLRASIDRKEPYAVLVTDLQMPDMDGLAVSRAARVMPGTGPLKIVMLTSVSQVAESKDVDARLVKPVRQDRLLKAVLGALGLRPDSQPLPAALRSTTAREQRPVVLLAEDNAVNRQVATEMLDVLGYAVDVAFDGAAAIAAIERKRYAVVLMDCQMPGVDGYEAARRIRAAEAHGTARLPLVAVTAHAMVGDREKAIDAGMDDYLPKPLTLEKLQHMLARWVRERPTATPAVAMPTASSDGARPLDPTAKRSKRVLELVLAQLGPAVTAIESAHTGGDATALRAAAHKLKGTCLSIGAGPLATRCKEIELGAWSDLTGERLRADSAALREAIENELATHAQSGGQDRR